MRVLVLISQVLRTARRNDSGQSLIVVVSAMTVLLGIAGFAIDAAQWMVRHHDAQVVADSAALAAAQCLANPGSTNSTIEIAGSQQTVPKCSSGSDVADAQTVAVDYAAANGVTITASQVNVNTSTDVVTVSASTTTPSVLARVMGIGATSQTARAGAGWQTGANVCSSPGAATCDFMFAHDENCAGGVSAGIDVQINGNSSVSGNIQSNGNLTVQSNGNPSWGNGSYGPSSNGNCQSIDQYNGHDAWASPPTQDTVNYPYPVDYSKDFPACGSGAEAACASNGYPSFCTNEGANITLDGSTTGDTAITNQIYCAAGTGTKSDPSTWNGSITISLSGKDTLYDTFVGGSMSFNGNGKDVLSSCGYNVSGYDSTTCSSSVSPATTPNYPIFYATGTSSTALDIQVNGSQTMNGDMFVPNGGATLQMNGNKTLTTFIEANDITANVGGTFQGDGPAAGTSGSSGSGGISLVQ